MACEIDGRESGGGRTDGPPMNEGTRIDSAKGTAEDAWKSTAARSAVTLEAKYSSQERQVSGYEAGSKDGDNTVASVMGLKSDWRRKISTLLC